ncbi:NAD(P)H-binding protein, partial [uncultured Roseobacter sp.]|uniref:SDR family oxidoreductase n=1 Tax=uncultured Roseobacter sp. TaxID=114847 RepID=UPI002633F0E6
MTSTTPKTVAIFGATGAQGAPVVKEALSKGHTVRAVARDAAKIAALHPNAVAVAADLSDADAVAEALRGVDAAFLHFPMPSGPDDSQNWAAAFFASAHKVNLPLLVYVTGGPSGDRFPSSAIVDGTTQGMSAVLGSGIPSIVLQSAVYLENLQPEIFLPGLRSEGRLDYPPIPQTMKMQWTSHLDQATLAVAA